MNMITVWAIVTFVGIYGTFMYWPGLKKVWGPFVLGFTAALWVAFIFG
jgi:hypothetical protein